MSAIRSVIDLLRPLHFRGKVRLFSPLVPSTGVRRVKVHGAWMELDLSEHIQRMMYLGTFEPWETRVVRQALRPGMCFIDVGANAGYFTTLAARLVGPMGRVVAVEPSADAVSRCRRVVEENGLACVRVEAVGLGDRDGEVTLYDALPDNHSPTKHGETGSPGRAVRVRRLDDALDEWGVGGVDLLKVDVEGHEPAVFTGAEGALKAGRVKAILCEFNAHWLLRAGTTAAALRDRLLEIGFDDVTHAPWDDNAALQNRLFRLRSGGGRS